MALFDRNMANSLWSTVNNRTQTNAPGAGMASPAPGSNLYNYMANQAPATTTAPSVPVNVSNASNNGTMLGAPAPNQVKQPGADLNTPGVVQPTLPTQPAANDTNTIGGAPTLPPATSLQEGGASNPLATDTMGSKLFESLQGQRTAREEELANRLNALGIRGGQAASALSRADRDFGLGLSQGLGEFNINRLQQAANINRDYLQLELQRQLGLGNLNLNSQQLDAQIALRLAELAQYADTQTRQELMDLFGQYFGTSTNPVSGPSSGGVLTSGGNG